MNDLDLCGMNYIEVYDRHKEEVMVDRMVHEARKELEIYYDDDDRPSVWDDDDLYYDPTKKYND